MENLVTPINTASRSFPSAFIVKWAIPVLNINTGKFLEYYQLLTHNKLSNIWN